MDQETKEIISKQTGENDLLLIEKTYFECEHDIGATICKLQNITYPEHKKQKTEFDQIRVILNEKDQIYQEMIDRTKR